jgi:hypothetical protein
MFAQSAMVRAGILAGALIGGSAAGLAPPGSAAFAAPVINEIVARPRGGEGEWIEIHNPGSAAVSIEGWTLADATNKPKKIPGPAVLAPGGFLVLAAKPDSVRVMFALADTIVALRPDGWPVLNDHDAAPGAPADVLVLADASGAVIDSVAYFEAWLPIEAGVSLERVDARGSALEAGAWGWSFDERGATPGRRNTLTGSGDASRRGAIDGPTRVNPGRGPAVFDFELPAPGTMALRLLDVEGREVAVLREPAPAPAVGRWVWGSDAPLPPRSGRYFLCMQWRAEGEDPVRACRSVWVSR